MNAKATVYPIVPEVCQFCTKGIAWMNCDDGAFRCRDCVHSYAAEMGWDKVPDRYKHVEKPSIIPVVPAEEPKAATSYQPEMF